MKTKIAILGANSYIARNLYFELNQDKEKYDIKLYDYQETSLDYVREYQSIQILECKSAENIDLNVDIIYMFTGRTGSANGFDEYENFIDINEVALLNLLNEYRKQKSNAKIVFPSTRLVYRGKAGEILSENADKEFKTIYAINKFACEQYLEMYGRVYGVKYAIFRICIPYGTLIPNASSYGTAEFMIKKAQSGENISLYGDGSVRRTLTYMGDLCKILVAGALSKDCLNNIYNIGGENYSLKEMAEVIAKRYGVGIDFVPWPEVALEIESGDTVFDSRKLDCILGFCAESKLETWCKNALV